MEKAIIVTYDLRSAHNEKSRKASEELALKDVNEHIMNGWKIRLIAPMSGTSGIFSSAIVVLEKD